MTPQEFYQIDREAWHKKLKLTPEATKRKQETLKITVLGLVRGKGQRLRARHGAHLAGDAHGQD
jgi:hypothetical protein